MSSGGFQSANVSVYNVFEAGEELGIPQTPTLLIPFVVSWPFFI